MAGQHPAGCIQFPPGSGQHFQYLLRLHNVAFLLS
jgi:hypothetical protein